MHPARVVGIQLHRAAHDRGASLELARVHDLQPQDPDRVGVERIEGHRALGRRAKRREVLPEEVHLRQRDERELVRPIELDRAAARGQGAIERGRVAARKAERVFVDVDLREAGPEVRLPVVPLHDALQPALERRVRRGRDLLAVGEILELPLHRREIDVVLPPDRVPHRMHEHPVAVGDGCDDAGGDVVLHREDARRLEVPVVGLGPELRSRLGVDELGAQANGRTSPADASFQHVTRAELGAEGPFVSRLSLQAGRRGARDDRQIPKPRKPGRDLLGEAIRERLHLRVTRALEGKHGDPESRGTDRRRGFPSAARDGRGGLLRKVERDVSGRLEPAIAVLLQAMLDDAVESRGNVPSRLRQLRRLVSQDCRHRLGVRVPLERLLAREHLVEDRPEREDVRAVVDRESLHLLGRHVARGPHDRPGLRVALVRGSARLLARSDGLDPLRQAEVEDLDVAVPADEEVLGLQVPMDDALLVRRGETPGNLERVVHGLLLGDRAGVELPAQRLAFQKLHDGVRDAVLVAEIVDRQDVLMGERRDRLRLALEPGERVGIGRDGLREDLDRDLPIELPIPRPVDLPHPARAQWREDLVGAETGPGGKCHRIGE